MQRAEKPKHGTQRPRKTRPPPIPEYRRSGSARQQARPGTEHNWECCHPRRPGTQGGTSRWPRPSVGSSAMRVRKQAQQRESTSHENEDAKWYVLCQTMINIAARPVWGDSWLLDFLTKVVGRSGRS